MPQRPSKSRQTPKLGSCLDFQGESVCLFHSSGLLALTSNLIRVCTVYVTDQSGNCHDDGHITCHALQHLQAHHLLLMFAFFYSAYRKRFTLVSEGRELFTLRCGSWAQPCLISHGSGASLNTGGGLLSRVQRQRHVLLKCRKVTKGSTCSTCRSNC